MADIETKPAAYPVAKPTFTVSTKSTLAVATAWTVQPNLYCERVSRRVNGMDEALLTFQAGDNVRQIGSITMGTAAPLDLVGHFVKIEFTDATNGDFVWTGYLVEESDRRELTAPQVFRAVGLEYFLDRTQIFSAVIDDGKIIGRSVPFNDPSAAGTYNTRRRGNRTTGTPSSGVPEFAASEATRTEWTVADILKYLMEYYHPVDNIGATTPCTWRPPSVIHEPYLRDYIVSFDPSGKTVYEILNALISPRRSLCWWLEYSEVSGVTGTATINIASLNQQSVTLPSGGGNLPANIAQFTLDYDDDPTVASQSIATSSKGNYKAIRCRGARITSTFTATVGDEFTTDWTTASENLYDAAASLTTGYGALATEEQANRNDAWRRDETLYRVYCAYRIPSNWDGLADTNFVFPDNLGNGFGTKNLTFHANWLRILPRTLLARGTDYETIASLTEATPDDSGDDLTPPFAIVEVATSPSKYQYCDKLSTADFEDGTAVEERFTASYALATQQDCPGILLRPSNGLNHMLAKNHFAGAEPTTAEPELDYDDLQFTVSVEADHHCEAVYPTVVQSGAYEELLIDVGDNYRLDYLVPGTVVRLDNGSLVTTDGGIIRDDRPQLRDIARFAYEWYREEKKTLSVTWRQMATWFELGYMLTDVGNTAPSSLDTVVAEISYDFSQMTTSIRTLGDQLNVQEVI